MERERNEDIYLGSPLGERANDRSQAHCSEPGLKYLSLHLPPQSLLSSQSREVGVGRQEAVSRGSEDGWGGVQRVGGSYFCSMVFQMSGVLELPHN